MDERKGSNLRLRERNVQIELGSFRVGGNFIEGVKVRYSALPPEKSV